MTVYIYDPRCAESVDWSGIYRMSNDPIRQVGALLHLSTHEEFTGANRIEWTNNNFVDHNYIWVKNRNIARGLVVHAEEAAIKRAIEAGVVNFTNSILIVTLEPCVACRRLIEAVGISEVFYGEMYICGQ